MTAPFFVTIMVLLSYVNKRESFFFFLKSLEPESTKGEWEVEYRNQLSFPDLKLSVGR